MPKSMRVRGPWGGSLSAGLCTLALGSTLALLPGCKSGPEIQAATGAEQTAIGTAVATINREAQSVRPLCQSRFALDFLQAAPQLPGVVPRRLGEVSADEWVYYYGPQPGPHSSPVAFAHLLDLVAQDGNERSALIGRRLLDLTGQGIGTTRLLAGAGADATAVLSDPQSRLLYGQPGDQGPVPVYGRDVAGRVSLVFAGSPSDPSSLASVGGGYDFVFIRSLLKRGLIHPSPPQPAQLSLGLSDEDYLRRLASLLKPGGRLLVYNQCPAPAPAGQPEKPEADCRNPFPQAAWQGAGFRVRDYDRSDTPAARSLGRALGWDRPDLGARAMDLETNLFALYTLVERS